MRALAHAESPDARPALDWTAAFDRRDGWTGGDVAASIPLPNGETLWLFGDTWIGHVDEGRHAPGSAMVPNTIAVQPTSPSPSPIRFYWGGPTATGKPSAFVSPPERGETSDWLWPTGGGAIGPQGELLFFLTRVGRRGTHGGTWDFEPHGSSLAIVDAPATDPQGWKPRVVELAPPQDSARRTVIWGAALVAPEEPGAPVHIAGIDSSAPAHKRLLMARAPAAGVSHFDTWRFWTGRAWSERSEEAVGIVDPIASELSIHSIGQGRARRFVMVYADIGFGSAIYARSAPRPEGPWSSPVTLFDSPEPRSLPGTFVYAAKAHPELSRPDALLVSYCVNSHDLWDVAAHAERYRPRFVWIPTANLPP